MEENHMNQAFEKTQTVGDAIVDQSAALSPKTTVYRSGKPAGWLSDAVREIDALGGLEPNWDSYGAHPIQSEAIVWAVKYLSELAHWAGVPRPHVGASPAGRVGLSWDKGSWSLDAEIDEAGLIRYGYIDERDDSLSRDSRTRDFSPLIPWLTQWD